MWQRLVELMDNLYWAHEELFKDRLSRGRNMDALKLFFEEWSDGWKKADSVRRGAGQAHPDSTPSQYC